VTAALATTPAPEDQWLTLDEAAEELNVTRSTLTRYARQGKVLRIYHAGRVYTTRASIENYKKTQAQNAEAKRASLEKQNRRRR
jgi:excisionase family DNA binding protein